MATPTQSIPRIVPQSVKDVHGGGYITYTTVYHIGNMTLAQALLTPGLVWPEDTTVFIDGATREKIPNENTYRAIVTSRTADFLQSIQTRSGTASSGGTTITATTAIFYPSIVGKTVTFDSNPYTVATYVSPTVITVTLTAGTTVSKTITFDEGSRALSLHLSDSNGWDRAGWWTNFRRYHCLTGDRYAEVRYLKSTTYTFDADDHSVVGTVSSISQKPIDSLVDGYSLINVTYQGPIYDK